MMNVASFKAAAGSAVATICLGNFIPVRRQNAVGGRGQGGGRDVPQNWYR